tara:strand:- start:5617 stop:5982 length:366 start_codon:yes stop_codon:yes gene_type:complete
MRPQFKNSRIKVLETFGAEDQISASFWFNIQDPNLQKSLEMYYALANEKPNLQFQIKRDGNYQTIGSCSLFLNDDRRDELIAESKKINADNTADKNDSQESGNAYKEAKDGANFPFGANNE